jgi:hypothetical protein
VGEGESLNPRVDGIALLCLGYLSELVLDALRLLQKRPVLRGRVFLFEERAFFMLLANAGVSLGSVVGVW